MTGDNVFVLVLLEEDILSHALKTGFWYILGDFFKICNKHQRLFNMAAPFPRSPRRL